MEWGKYLAIGVPTVAKSKVAASGISDKSEWKALEDHAKVLTSLHLRNLLKDSSRTNSLTAQFDGIILDYSRQKVLPETIDLLLDLAVAAGLNEKRAAMQAGAHINSTEDRAVLHVALRAPRDFPAIIVDGENVLPAVHQVLDKVFAAFDISPSS